MLNRIGAFLKGILVKYWIVCCCSMFFVISFSGKVVVYKILYICLFLICVVLYQVRLPLPFKHSHIGELSTGHPSLETCRLSWSKCIRYILIQDVQYLKTIEIKLFSLLAEFSGALPCWPAKLPVQLISAGILPFWCAFLTISNIVVAYQ